TVPAGAAAGRARPIWRPWNETGRPRMIRTGPLVLLAVLGLAPSAWSQQTLIRTQAGALEVQTVADGFEHPWSIVFLPDGDMLVTERPGRLRRISPDGTTSPPLNGVPEVFARGGGLLDLALDPDFETTGLVYLSFAEPGDGGASTAVARGRLGEAGLGDVEVIFRQQPKVAHRNHFGGRLVFAPDGTLFVTLGERFQFDPAQNLSDHLGTIVRINPDGSVPDDNPFVDRDGALPEIWSYGHRNLEAAAIHPDTGDLWVAEMGPKGGDELNRPEAGRNYGWPLVSWGNHYDGRRIPDPPTRPELAGSAYQWTPVISPSGMVFNTGGEIAGWRGSMLIGGLSGKAIVRVEIAADGSAAEAERLELGVRIRDVEEGPDGAVYALTDEANGKILRFVPADGG